MKLPEDPARNVYRTPCAVRTRPPANRLWYLVDEYDKPIKDLLEDQDFAKANQDYFSGFYGIIKDSAEHVRFVFATGVRIFSG